MKKILAIGLLLLIVASSASAVSAATFEVYRPNWYAGGYECDAFNSEGLNVQTWSGHLTCGSDLATGTFPSDAVTFTMKVYADGGSSYTFNNYTIENGYKNAGKARFDLCGALGSSARCEYDIFGRYIGSVSLK
ncbi:MAG: hypothetical protein LBB45_08580 [Methanobrevibacter sp.]|jgi:hypothetical protein|nr:hypothetical protein [Candidatus Methanovirga basalitermitum]